MPNNRPGSLETVPTTWTSYTFPLEFYNGSIVYFDERDPLADLIEDANDGIEAIRKLTKEHKGKFKIVNGKLMKKENT